MSLYVVNRSGTAIQLAGLSTIVPASASPPGPSEPVNVTGEVKNLTNAERINLETQRIQSGGALQYYWTDIAEFSTGALTTTQPGGFQAPLTFPVATLTYQARPGERISILPPAGMGVFAPTGPAPGVQFGIKNVATAAATGCYVAGNGFPIEAQAAGFAPAPTVVAGEGLGKSLVWEFNGSQWVIVAAAK